VLVRYGPCATGQATYPLVHRSPGAPRGRDQATGSLCHGRRFPGTSSCGHARSVASGEAKPYIATDARRMPAVATRNGKYLRPFSTRLPGQLVGHLPLSHGGKQTLAWLRLHSTAVVPTRGRLTAAANRNKERRRGHRPSKRSRYGGVPSPNSSSPPGCRLTVTGAGS
jgi:hypothetical protein